MIKAIETVYNRYRFRSRLEARWAVFFDAAGIKYRYEPEGFKLKDGTLYLPDFYLPEFHLYVEIKSARENDDGKAERFGYEIASNIETGQTGMLICYGLPDAHDFMLIANEYTDSGGGPTAYGEFFPRELRFTCYNDTKEKRQYPILLVERDRWDAEIPLPNVFTTGQNPPFEDYPIECAEIEARQARFEHGEKPRKEAQA